MEGNVVAVVAVVAVREGSDFFFGVVLMERFLIGGGCVLHAPLEPLQVSSDDADRIQLKFPLLPLSADGNYPALCLSVFRQSLIHRPCVTNSFIRLFYLKKKKLFL